MTTYAAEDPRLTPSSGPYRPSPQPGWWNQAPGRPNPIQAPGGATIDPGMGGPIGAYRPGVAVDPGFGRFDPRDPRQNPILPVDKPGYDRGPMTGGNPYGTGMTKEPFQIGGGGGIRLDPGEWGGGGYGGFGNPGGMAQDWWTKLKQRNMGMEMEGGFPGSIAFMGKIPFGMGGGPSYGTMGGPEMSRPQPWLPPQGQGPQNNGGLGFSIQPGTMMDTGGMAGGLMNNPIQGMDQFQQILAMGDFSGIAKQQADAQKAQMDLQMKQQQMQNQMQMDQARNQAMIGGAQNMHPPQGLQSTNNTFNANQISNGGGQTFNNPYNQAYNNQVKNFFGSSGGQRSNWG